MSGKETVYCYAVDDDIKVYTDYVLERGWVKDTKAADEAFAFTSEGKRTWAVWDSDGVLKIMYDTF